MPSAKLPFPTKSAVSKAVRKNGTFLCYEANLAKHGLKGTPFGRSFTALKRAGHGTKDCLVELIPFDHELVFKASQGDVIRHRFGFKNGL